MTVFGNGNVSNVSAAFVAGANLAGLSLNPFFNGTTNTQMLTGGQQLPNRILNNQDYFFKIRVSCRVTNLNVATTYRNSAVITGDIGNQLTGTLSTVTDSSNNGESTVIDPNKNGNPSDLNENIPTPFVFSSLPVKFIEFSATSIGSNAAKLQWKIAVPVENAARFEIEFSTDGRSFETAGTIIIADLSESSYQFVHKNMLAGDVLYRIKEIDDDGSITYSKIVLLRKTESRLKFTVYPNPAREFIKVISNESTNKKITLLDATGRRLQEISSSNQLVEIRTTSYPNGSYLLQIRDGAGSSNIKIIVQH